MTDLRISVRNTSDAGGTFLTPFYLGFHDGGFDLFNAGSAASAGLEALAEDGNFTPLAAERVAAAPDSQGLVVAGAGGPIATGEFTSNTIDVDETVNTEVSLAAMILPSNDAFVGTDTAVTLFDGMGTFLGAQTITFAGSDVYDAGTEVNTEEDAAFLNQTGPDTGVDEGGVVALHQGFNGSDGTPGGTQNILGGTNAFGIAIDETAADFTLPGSEIATVHINEVVEIEGTNRRDFVVGGAEDDIVNAGGRNDLLLGRGGWDVLNGEGGNDRIFAGAGDDIASGGDGRDWISGGTGNDMLDGGAGRDGIVGGAGDDMISGGSGGDWLAGSGGADVISGGTGNDTLRGGQEDDTFVFAAGDGRDVIRDFDDAGDDVIALDVTGIESFADVQTVASQVGASVELDFGMDGTLVLFGTQLNTLSDADFSFG